MSDSISCDCWRLTQPLESSDAPLPDHICFSTQRATVESWVRDTWQDYTFVIEDFFRQRLSFQQEVQRQFDERFPPTVLSEQLQESLYGRNYRRALQDAEQEQDELPRRDADQFRTSMVSEWPFPHNGRRLGLVIRQWAEEAPSETLANKLAGSCDWQAEVEYLREEVYAVLLGRAVM